MYKLKLIPKRKYLLGGGIFNESDIPMYTEQLAIANPYTPDDVRLKLLEYVDNYNSNHGKPARDWDKILDTTDDIVTGAQIFIPVLMGLCAATGVGAAALPALAALQTGLMYVGAGLDVTLTAMSLHDENYKSAYLNILELGLGLFGNKALRKITKRLETAYKNYKTTKSAADLAAYNATKNLFLEELTKTIDNNFIESTIHYTNALLNFVSIYDTKPAVSTRERFTEQSDNTYVAPKLISKPITK